MKILAVLGARKNGNTDEIVRYFAESLSSSLESEPTEIEYLYLCDYPVPFCTGCHSCILRGEEQCPHYEQVKPIEEKMLQADGLILASPGYMFSVTGIMKNFLDHVAYNCHRPKYFGKPAYLLSACTTWQKKGVFLPMNTWASGAGFTVAGETFTDLMPFPQAEKDLNKKRALLQRGARKYGEALLRRNQPLTPGFGEFMIFNAFSEFSRLMPKVFEADHRYFHEGGITEPEGKWYRPAKLRFFPAFAARLLFGRVKKGLNGMIDHERLGEGKKVYKNRL